MLAAFQVFISRMKADFARISRATRNELSPDELKTEAWIMAHALGEKRQREIDFNDDQDRQLILGALYIQHVKRRGKSVRYTLSIDQSYDGDEGEVNPWENRLTAEETSDPAKLLIKRESAINEKNLLANSYSQAAAYVMVCVHFKNNKRAVCTYLAISDSTLRSRVHKAANNVRMQPSLFDGIERIAKSFMPPRGRLYRTMDLCIKTYPRNEIPHPNYPLFV